MSNKGTKFVEGQLKTCQGQLRYASEDIQLLNKDLNKTKAEATSYQNKLLFMSTMPFIKAFRRFLYLRK